MRCVKTTLWIYVLALWGCTVSPDRSAVIKRFIPGTYVKEVKNQFYIGNDTFIIQRISGNNYLIVNRTGYQRIRENKVSPLKHSETNLMAVYNDKSENLFEQRLGKTFSFDPDNRRLFEGASEYTKVMP